MMNLRKRFLMRIQFIYSVDRARNHYSSDHLLYNGLYVKFVSTTMPEKHQKIQIQRNRGEVTQEAESIVQMWNFWPNSHQSSSKDKQYTQKNWRISSWCSSQVETSFHCQRVHQKDQQEDLHFMSILVPRSFHSQWLNEKRNNGNMYLQGRSRRTRNDEVWDFLGVPISDDELKNFCQGFHPAEFIVEKWCGSCAHNLYLGCAGSILFSNASLLEWFWSVFHTSVHLAHFLVSLQFLVVSVLANAETWKSKCDSLKFTPCLHVMESLLARPRFAGSWYQAGPRAGWWERVVG